MPNFPYRNYMNESGGVVRAHVVTEATEGDVTTVEGNRAALAGDVVVAHQNEHFVDIMDGNEFAETYTEATDDDLRELQEQTTESPQGQGAVQKNFNPNDRKAAEVRDYLSKVKSQDEYDRVAQLERDGRNRSSAIPDRTWDDE